MTKCGIYGPVSIALKFSKSIGYTLHDYKSFHEEKILEVKSGQIIQVIVITTLMLVPYFKYWEVEFEKRSTTVKLLSLICGLRVFGCISIIISDLRKQVFLIKATKYLDQVDKELKKLGKPVTYKKWSKLLKWGCSATVIFVIISRVLFFLIYVPLWTIITDFFINGYPFMILSTNIYYLIFFLSVIRIRFSSLLSLLRENHKELVMAKDKHILKKFLKITQMYSDLYNCSKCINQFISLPSFICVMCNLLDGMLVAYLMYLGEGGIKDVYRVASYLWLTLATLLSPMLVEKMPGKICRMLAGIEIPVSQKELRKAKNTFLYQALHTKVKFTVCGIFPMSMSSLFEQFSFSISLILVMYQIAG